MGERQEEILFCESYLESMSPEAAARRAGRKNGYALLKKREIKRYLEQMRQTAAAQIQKEDVIRRLTQLAFGKANDAVKLAARGSEKETEELDLSAVSELKITEKGIEVKFLDRVRALETLYTMLDTKSGQDPEQLYRALSETAKEIGEAWNES